MDGSWKVSWCTEHFYLWQLTCSETNATLREVNTGPYFLLCNEIQLISDSFWGPEFAWKNVIFLQRYQLWWQFGWRYETIAVRSPRKVFPTPLFGGIGRFRSISIRVKPGRKMGLAERQVYARLRSNLPELYKKMAVFWCSTIPSTSKYTDFPTVSCINGR